MNEHSPTWGFCVLHCDFDFPYISVLSKPSFRYIMLTLGGGERMYTTVQLKIGKSEELDRLAHEAGIVYSQTVVTFWRAVRNNNHWLSQYGMQRLIGSSTLH